MADDLYLEQADLVQGKLELASAKAQGLGAVITLTIVSILINSVVLWMLSKWFKFEKTEYKYAILGSLLAGMAGFLFSYLAFIFLSFLLWPLGYLTSVVLIKYIYSEEWGKAFLVGAIWWVAGMILNAIVAFIVLAVVLF